MPVEGALVGLVVDVAALLGDEAPHPAINSAAAAAPVATHTRHRNVRDLRITVLDVVL